MFTYFALMGEWNPPEYVIHTRGGVTFQPAKGMHVLNRAEGHRCEVNTLGILACNSIIFLRSLKGICFRNRLQNN